MKQRSLSGSYQIQYEDEDLLVIDKAQGLATTPGKKTNLCQIIFRDKPQLQSVTGYKKGEGGLLNRLDNETGGIVLFAKTDFAFAEYSKMMKAEKIEKYYLAVVAGVPRSNSGLINWPIAHHAKNKKKMVIVENHPVRGKPQLSATKWRIMQTLNQFRQFGQFKQCAVLEVQIKKGIRHQIRLHLKALGHPILGDKLYCPQLESGAGLPFHLLYAYKIVFEDLKQKTVTVQTRIPFYDIKGKNLIIN